MDSAKLSRRMLMRAALVVAVLLVLVFANWPQPPQLPGGLSDGVQHAAAFAGLTVAARLAYPQVRWQILTVVLSAFGLGIELVQGLLPFNRSPSLADWLVDCLAIMIALAVIAILQKLGPVFKWLARR